MGTTEDLLKNFCINYNQMYKLFQLNKEVTLTCFPFSDDAVAVPQLQEPETTVPMNMEALRRSTPLPLLHSRLSQSHARTAPSTISNHQENTNSTMKRLHDT
ncbi:hypothetical protein C0J52_25262 [Blattella germanica]|nr:hypothetical protein C0J52_25262 [Blattella germanica]